MALLEVLPKLNIALTTAISLENCYCLNTTFTHKFFYTTAEMILYSEQIILYFI